MDIRKLQRAIVDGLEDVKAQHIEVYNTENLSALFERVIIATGASNRQTKALAASVRDAVRSRGMQVMRTEGEENGEWIIVDCGAAVVHIMQPAIREYYHLEEIWGSKPVRMKMGIRSGALVKASEGPDDEPDAAPAARARASAPKAGGAQPRSRAAAAAKPRRPSTPRQPASQGKARTLVVGKPAAKRPANRGAKAPAGRAATAAKRRG
jgi:ribosome-associated protein